MNYLSTRDSSVTASAEQAIVNGICSSGGLFVPSSFPDFTLETIELLMRMDYYERAAFILHKFLPSFDYRELLVNCRAVYSQRFGLDPTPIEMADGVSFLELWHGRTLAFKDFALQILPFLLVRSKEYINEKRRTLILTATSGDTGAATIEGFKNVIGCAVSVFYPFNGVAPLQKLQMTSNARDNVSSFAIKGNFDDAQNSVKDIFSDESFKKKLDEQGFMLASANSINLGRLLPQIVYYFSAYADLCAYKTVTFGEKVNFCVPSGNFGDILAGYYAKKMGLPINKLICASNANNVLTDFIRTGRYDIRRQFLKTKSPSMDILISSNLERLLFELSGRNCELVKNRMESLKTEGFYDITQEELKALQADFEAVFALDSEADEVTRDIFENTSYLVDPHTAVAITAYRKYLLESNDITRSVIVSTASPFKFPSSVLKAIGQIPGNNEFSNIEVLCKLLISKNDSKEPTDYQKMLEFKRKPEAVVSIWSILKREEEIAETFNLKPILALKDMDVNEEKVIEKDSLRSEILKFCSGLKDK